MSKPTDTPAFPVCAGHHVFHTGMELRDWFAGQIAAGMAAYSGTMGRSFPPCAIAARAYVVADAMIAARDAGAP